MTTNDVPADTGDVAQHPKFTEFKNRVFEKSPEAREAYERAESRFVLATTKTKHGFELGDVIAETVLASDWLAVRDAAQRAEERERIAQAIEAEGGGSVTFRIAANIARSGTAGGSNA